VSATAPATRFTLPAGRSATEPPEIRGLARDEVRLLVARPDGISHARFRDLGTALRPGDLLVVNTSATLAAAVDGTRADGGPALVHFATPLGGGAWVVELRAPGNTGPALDGRAGERVRLPAGVTLTLLDGHPDRSRRSGGRLWRAAVAVEGGVEDWLAANGRPVTYGYTRGRWPLAMYQTVFAREPGSAEMPSAGRPFTERLVTSLTAMGVTIAPITLHTGLSSPEAHEPPQAERFRVPDATAALAGHTRRNGGRVIAVGTTATRALETMARPDGTVEAGLGWTELVLGPDHPARVVDGLITGWHEPAASHLLLLEAVAGPELVQRAYDAAIAGDYLWHELGDSCLLLPR
jgi:S-adenosylmethionine:tRNA ribosyltransferase-isomerase